jgi:hypothetical protein
MNYKNLKIVRHLQAEVSPRLRWLAHANKIDKSSLDYVRMITGVEELQSTAYEKEMEAMVRRQLAEEFPGIENMKSYEQLVDAVMLNLKQKQIEML